jgi:L-fuculose-phosphate aldolase
MVSEYEIKKQICEFGKRIYDMGMEAAERNNIVVKLVK